MASSQKKNVFLVHQNIPGQFKHLAPALIAEGHNLYFITAGEGEVANSTKVKYKIDQPFRNEEQRIFHYAQRVAKSIVHLRNTLSIEPDIILGHVSWGELMFCRDLLPNTPIIGYFEWFHSEKEFLSYPTYVGNENAPYVLRTRNVPNYVCGDICDAGYTPTNVQFSTFPKFIQQKLSVIHDGVDTFQVRRPSSPTLKLPSGRVLTREDRIVTYVSRSLEAARGFDVFMQSVEELCRKDSSCHVVIVGDDNVSYGNPLPSGETYRQHILQKASIDSSRVHFLGRVPYSTFLDCLYVSAVHVYLTFPFVLSWSMLEAMAAECLVIGSRTPSVQEVIVNGHNGLLTDFYDHSALAEKIAVALGRPRDYDEIRREARRTILHRFDLHGVCLPRQKALIQSFF